MTMQLVKDEVLQQLAPQQLLRHYGVAFKVSGDQLRTRLCPVCGERSSDSVVMNRLDGRWHCKAHGHKGDVLKWIAALEKLSCRNDFAEVLARAHAISGTISPLGDDDRPPRALPSDRTVAHQFARAHVPALWEHLGAAQGDVLLYLERRQLGALARRPDLVRATPAPIPGETPWHRRVRGLLSMPAIVVPTYDLDDGQIYNLTSRRIGVAEHKVVGLPNVPKTLSGMPLGTFGRWTDFERCPRNVVLVEGVADYLTACLVMPEWLVLGIDGGSLVAGIVARIAPAIAAAGVTLRLVPHNDAAGELAARDAVDRARDAGLVLGCGLELLDVGSRKDLNDALCAGTTSVLVPPGAASLETVVGRVAVTSSSEAIRECVDADAAPGAADRPRSPWITPLADFLGDGEPDDDDRADWIIRDIIPRGEPAMIAGPPKSGKTWMATDLALSIASGTPWLESFENTMTVPSRVLAVLLEDSERRVRKRIWQLARGRGLDPRQLHDTLAITRKRFGMPDRADLHALTAELHRWRPTVVLVDNLTRTMAGDPNATREAAEFGRAWMQLCQDSGAAVVFVHHTVKATPDERKRRNPRDRIRGSGDFVATARNVLVVDPVEADHDVKRSVVEVFGNLDLTRESFMLGYQASLDRHGRRVVRLLDGGDHDDGDRTTVPAVRAARSVPARDAQASMPEPAPHPAAADRAEVALAVAATGSVSIASLMRAASCGQGSASRTLAGLRDRGLLCSEGQQGHRLTEAGRVALPRRVP